MPRNPVIHGVSFCPGWEETWRALPPEIRDQGATRISRLIGVEVRQGPFGTLPGFADQPVWTLTISEDGLYIATFVMMDVRAYFQNAGLYQELAFHGPPEQNGLR